MSIVVTWFSHVPSLNRFILGKKCTQTNNTINTNTIPTTTTNSTNSTTDPKPPQSTSKKVVLVDIPYVGRPSFVLGKKMIKFSQQLRPDIKLQPIPRPPPTIQKLLPQKDPIHKNLQSHLVYQIQCGNCDAKYIGKTIRHAITRHQEHGAPKSDQQQPTKPTTAHTTSPANLRRSDRIKKQKVRSTLSTSLDILPVHNNT